MHYSEAVSNQSIYQQPRHQTLTLATLSVKSIVNRVKLPGSVLVIGTQCVKPAWAVSSLCNATPGYQPAEQ
jgi:hypothetical protein